MSSEAPPAFETRLPEKDRDPLLTRPKQAAFLAAYAECAIISRAADAAGIHKCTHYAWMKDDPDYAEEFRHAHESAIDLAEFEALRRATKGVERPLMFGGKQVQLQDPAHPDDPTKMVPGVIREYSDMLLMFILNAARPDKYRKRVEVKGSMEQRKTTHEIRETIHRIAINADGLSALELIARLQLAEQAEGAAPGAENAEQSAAGPVALLEAQPAPDGAQSTQNEAPSAQRDEPDTLGRVPGGPAAAAGKTDKMAQP